MSKAIGQIRNAKKWVAFSWSHRLIMTLAITGLVFGIRVILHPYLHERLAFLPFIFAAQIVAFFYGASFALFALILGALLGSYYFIPPDNEFGWPDGEDGIRLTGYFLASFIGIVLIEYLRRARYAARLLLMSQSRYNCLLRLDNHRLHLQRRATRARAELSELLENFADVLLLAPPSGHICVQPKYIEITGQSQVSSLQDWLEQIDSSERENIRDVIHAGQSGRFVKYSAPLHIYNQAQQHQLIDCVLQAIPLDSSKVAFALRLGKRHALRDSTTKESVSTAE